ncbi:MAG: glycosyltransferase family 4 protein [Candidatus Kerfeldbacteria bacterium]|nr:glycosyltransferase family 4 protein [Candidatus Kerfeldbacteria bacterium]
MVIGIDASRANTPDRTGTEWYSYYLLREFARTAQNHHLVLYTREPLQDDLRAIAQHMDVRTLRWPPRRFWTQIRLSGEMVRHAPDVLFVPAHTIPIVHPPRTVTTLHDVGFERYPHLYGRFELAYHRWAARFALRHARHVITVSEFSKREIVATIGADPNRITVIPLGYDTTQYRPDLPSEQIDRVTAQYGLTRDAYLFSIGRLEQKKNTRGLIEAYARARGAANLPLVLAGTPGFGYDQVTDAIRQLGVAAHVRQLGWIPQQDVPYLLAGARAFVFPSFYEGFGLPVLESMATGTPVIASTAGAVPEVAGQAAILVDPSDTEQLGNALIRLINDRELRSVLRSRGLERASAFRWSACAAATLQILQSVAEHEA